MDYISGRRPPQSGPRSNISKLGTEDRLDHILRRRPYLFGERCEIYGHNTLYVDYMTIIIKTTKNIAIRIAMKIDFIISELGKILWSNGLMLNANKIEILRTTTRQQLAENGEEISLLQTKNKQAERIMPESWTKILGMCFNSTKFYYFPTIEK